MSENNAKRHFSLKLYLLIVFALSWPVMMVSVIWARDFWTGTYLLLILSQLMVTTGTYIAGKYVFKDGFKDAGWIWGKPVHYLLVIGLSFLIFSVPAFLGTYLGFYSMNPSVGWVNFLLMMLGFSFISLIGAFGEEFGWRGYMLPHLAERYSKRKAVIYQGVIWWFWHTPFQAALYINALSGSANGIIFVIISLIVSTLFAVTFAYVWVNSQSLAVTSVYHSTGDAMGQSVLNAFGYTQYVGLGWWSPVVIVIIGMVLIFGGNWDKLGKNRKLENY